MATFSSDSGSARFPSPGSHRGSTHVHDGKPSSPTVPAPPRAPGAAHRAPAVGSPRPAVRGRGPSQPPPSANSGRPRIYWFPIAAAVLVSLLLVGGLVGFVKYAGAPARPGGEETAARTAERPGAEADRALASTPRSPGEGPEVPPDVPANQTSSTPQTACPPPAVNPRPVSTQRVPAAPVPSRDPSFPPRPDRTTPPPRQPAAPAETCAVAPKYGTSLEFVDDPRAAAQKALQEQKLLFVLHVAGNFEDDKFT